MLTTTFVKGRKITDGYYFVRYRVPTREGVDTRRIAMKRVKGTPWHKVIKARSLNENLNILLRVADAVVRR